jgi:hypothetical protein
VLLPCQKYSSAKQGVLTRVWRIFSMNKRCIRYCQVSMWISQSLGIKASAAPSTRTLPASLRHCVLKETREPDMLSTVMRAVIVSLTCQCTNSNMFTLSVDSIHDDAVGL